jgi:hypothetical protein
MRRSLAALVLLCVAGSQPLVGQRVVSPAHVAPGSRVRVTQPGEQPRTAVVVRHDADTLFVRWNNLADTAALPVGRITRLDVSAGTHRSVAKGAGMGVVIGGVAGALLGGLTYTPCEGLNCLTQPAGRGEAIAYGAGGGGLLGVIVGSLVGLKTHEDWERVSITPRVVSSRAFGAGLGVTLAF